MRDRDCVAFLQWCLPRLGLRWAGFRKVRRQVGRRLERRLAELGLPDVAAYRQFLAHHPGEWRLLRDLCRITISRFHRNRRVFEVLRERVLADMARDAITRTPPKLRCWSAGCASGEEPYTLAMLWALAIRPGFPGVVLELLATDVDPVLLVRAERALYPRSALRELPESWRERAFIGSGALWKLREELRSDVRFQPMNLLEQMPEGPFDLILCRYLAFTYFDESGQREIAKGFAKRLAPGGRLVIGAHESLPPGAGFSPTPDHPLIHRLVSCAAPNRDS